MDIKKLIIASTVAVSASFATSAVASTLINFETNYSDDQDIVDPFELLDSTGALSGVTLNSLTTMTIEATGTDAGNNTTDGFVTDTVGPGRVFDEETNDPSLTSSLGNFFLRTKAALDANLNQIDPVFSLDFETGANNISGEIWDIDGTGGNNTERWGVTAFDDNGQVAFQESPLGVNNGSNSLDGRPWIFDFGNNLITRIEFGFTGGKNRNIGVAFDNLRFTAGPDFPSEVPLPAAGWMLIAGVGGLFAMRRRKRKS